MAPRKPSSRKAGEATPKLAKLTPPRLSGIYARERLFRLLDGARKNPITWISAPAGAGKTTLLASYLQKRNLPTLWYQVDAGDNDIGAFFYHMGLATEIAGRRPQAPLPLLTAEYLEGLSAFTMNYFRQLFARLRSPAIVVFDNFQDITNETIHEVLRQGFEQIPPGINVVVLSRDDPSGQLARLRASGRMTQLGWNTLKLTERETGAIARLRGKQKLAPTALGEIYQQTQGWVAGLVLLTEQTTIGGNEPRIDKGGSQAIFDYFANEILRHRGASAQDFLLRTALLPKISLSIAQKLVPSDRRETVLQYLTRRNFFTVRHADGSYEYHPLFRAFLLSRLQVLYSPVQIQTIKRRCAELLAESGDVENAIVLLQESQDWRSALQLMLRNAEELRNQGRSQTLHNWLMTLPESVRSENAWVLYWLGICRVHFSPTEARRYFEQAFILFERDDDASPLYLAWSRIVESYLLEMNDHAPLLEWLNRYPTLKNGRKPPSERIEKASIFSYLIGLMNSRFGDPDVFTYAERAQQIYELETNPRRKLAQAATLIPYYMWRGDMLAMQKLIDQLAPGKSGDWATPLARLNWYMYRSLNCTIANAAEDARAIMDAIAFADSTGIHVIDIQLLGNGIWGKLGIGDVAAARTLLQRMSPLARRGQVKEAIYCHFASMVALHEGNLVRAIEDAAKAAHLAKTLHVFIGAVSYSIGLAFAYAQRGDTDAALAVLAQTRPLALSMRTKSFVSYIKLCEAQLHHLRGEHDAALRSLEEALSLAEQGGFVAPAYCSRDMAAGLYAMALDAGIQPTYVRATIEKTGLPPPPGLLSEKWPWKLHIYTLGRFIVAKNEIPLVFRGREHHKPLSLLRAVVAHGGRYVSIPKIAQQLWPDTEGDAAMHTFDTTLYRLRKLVGEDCLITHDGQISLNPDYCWLDVWAVEQLLDIRIGSLPRNLRVERLLDLYRGSFLEGDETPWVIVERERLRSKFLNVVTQIGRALETDNDYESAAACYRRGLEVDPYAEALYRQLMWCYRHLHRPAEAVSVYQRCYRTFTSMLRMEPTAETKALYEEIRREAS